MICLDCDHYLEADGEAVSSCSDPLGSCPAHTRPAFKKGAKMRVYKDPHGDYDCCSCIHYMEGPGSEYESREAFYANSILYPELYKRIRAGDPVGCKACKDGSEELLPPGSTFHCDRCLREAFSEAKQDLRRGEIILELCPDCWAMEKRGQVAARKRRRRAAWRKAKLLKPIIEEWVGVALLLALMFILAFCYR